MVAVLLPLCKASQFEKLDVIVEVVEIDFG